MKRAFVAAAKDLHKKARADQVAEVAAKAARHKELNDFSLNEHQALMMNFESEKISTTEVLTNHYMGEARLSLWIQILPSLGTTQFHKIQDTVTFASPAELVAAVELVIYRDRDGEKLQLQLELWQSSLAVEGGGDPIRFHRYVLLASKKLARLNSEPVRDSDMRALLIKGLPDDIFLQFKTNLHNNAAI